MAITQQHATAAALAGGCFVKLGEKVDDACKRFLKANERKSHAPEKRTFPGTADALASTNAYVREYCRINNLQYCGSFDNLSLNKTVWPDPALDTVEVVDA